MGSFTGIGKLPSELSEKTSLSETDIVITGSAAQRTTWKNVLEKISFSGLATTAKNIIGAINELNTNKITKGDDDVLYINGKVLPMSKGIGDLPVYSMHLMWHETDGWCVVIYFIYNNESYYGRAKLTDVVKK